MPSREEWIMKLWYIHTLEQLPAIKGELLLEQKEYSEGEDRPHAPSMLVQEGKH